MHGELTPGQAGTILVILAAGGTIAIAVVIAGTRAVVELVRSWRTGRRLSVAIPGLTEQVIATRREAQRALAALDQAAEGLRAAQAAPQEHIRDHRTPVRWPR